MACIGVDVHKDASTVAVFSEDPTESEPIEKTRVDNENLGDFAERYAGSDAVLEATGNYFTVYDTLAEHVEVTLANPLKLSWITESDQKTDEIDAEKLAKLHRVDMVPESYVPPEEIRRYRELTRARQTLVQDRTKWKNEIHALLDRHGIRYDGDLFTQEGRDFLETLDLDGRGNLLLEQWLDLIDDLSAKKETLDEEIVAVASTIDEVELLLTIPGVGPYRALVIHAELGEIERFDGEEAVVSYAGLDPTVKESGETRKEGSISKRGNSQLREVLVGAARTAVQTSKDPYLSDFYWRLREERNKPALVARVATARKLLVSIYHMLTREEKYNPPE